MSVKQKEKYILWIVAVVILFHSVMIFSISVAAEESIKNKIDFKTIDKLTEIGINLIDNEVNNYGKDGKKHGIWVNDNNYCIKMTSYNNGEKDGIQSIYCRHKGTIILAYLIMYSRNRMKSIVSFDEGTGLILGIIDDIEQNDESINYPKDWEPGFKFPYVGYSREYNSKNGQLVAEGKIILGEDWEIDCEPIGEWIIYSSDGAREYKNYGGVRK